MSETSTTKIPRKFVKSMVLKALDAVNTLTEAVSQPDKKAPYVNWRPLFRSAAVAPKQLSKIEQLRFRRSNQRKRRKLNRQINSRGFKFRYV